VSLSSLIISLDDANSEGLVRAEFEHVDNHRFGAKSAQRFSPLLCSRRTDYSCNPQFNNCRHKGLVRVKPDVQK
jgi:hypothetical protein